MPLELLNLNQETFDKLVNDDVLGKASQEVHDLLRSSEVVLRWSASLGRMAKSVEGTLAAREADHKAKKAKLLRTEGKDAWLQEKEDYERRRARTLRFYTGLQEHMKEAKLLREAINPREVVLEAERNALLDAIRDHRDRTDRVTQADLSLWRMITS